MGVSAFFSIDVFDLLSAETFLSGDLLVMFGGTIGVHVILFSLALLFGVEVYQNRRGNIREWLANQNLVFRWGVLLGLIFFILIFGMYGPDLNISKFIYAGF